MGHSGRTYATRYDLDRAKRSVVFKASVDTHALTSTAILSYPVPDLAGDVVVPEGIDFSRHMRFPAVDIEHRRDPEFGDATVGWAHTGLMKSDGYYTARHVPLDCDGETRYLPVGTTHFDPDNKLHQQAFAMVERDVLPAVSLEFIPDMTVAKSLGRSPLEPRNAYEFGRVSVVRWTLCAKGVCEQALVAKSLYDPLRSVLSAGRIGGEELHPTIKKALSHYLPGKSNTVVSGFTTEKKAMDEQYGGDVGTAEPEAAPVQSANGITALYSHAQALVDLCDQLEADAENTDSAEVLKDIQKMCEMSRAVAEKVMATADKHNAKLEAAKGKSDDDAGEEDEPEEMDDESEPDMDEDEDGMLKAIPARHRTIVKALRVKRFTLAEIQKAEQKHHVPDVDDETARAELARELELARKERARAARDRKIYG